MRICLICLLFGVLSFALADAQTSSARTYPSKPNIVFVFCDDLGYGDVQCLNPENGKIPTPAADSLAEQGMIFTDAHSGSSVCTPTRYGLLTGRYSWRTALQKGVVTGFAPNLIAEERPTVASFLKEQGYHTAIIGKWHLNFRYTDPKTGEDFDKNELKRKYGNRLPPVGARIPDGPLTRGFDVYHGFHHARDMKAVIENDTVILHEDPISMLPRLEKESVAYIEERAAKHPEKPFFLYVPLGSPHTPIVPSPEWQGKSGLNRYADFVMQTDAALGSILAALERNGLADNTLVIFSSDNGCSKAANIDQLREKGHYVSGEFRGSKADIWDGGHRVPFIVRWPEVIKRGSTSDQLICLTDFFATVADITGHDIPEGSCEDSVSFLPAFNGQKIVSSRNGVIHHSISGHFAYREGDWKLVLARGSGGWSAPNENSVPSDSPEAQLYDLSEDIGETTNLYTRHHPMAQRLLQLLENDVRSGRSTDGPQSQNDVDDIVLWKSGRAVGIKK